VGSGFVCPAAPPNQRGVLHPPDLTPRVLAVICRLCGADRLTTCHPTASRSLLERLDLVGPIERTSCAHIATVSSGGVGPTPVSSVMAFELELDKRSAVPYFESRVAE